MEFLPTRPLNPGEAAERKIVILIYGLYIAVAITGIFGPLIGLIIAYWQRRKISSVLAKSHIANLIRLFWQSFFGVVGGVVWVVFFASTMGRDYDYLLIPGASIFVLSIVWFFAKAALGFGKAFRAHVA